ncbi:MAG: hypothetical protein Q9195_003633 [Heterodermia aff. obscurata]
MAPESTALTVKVDSGSPYQLSQPQVPAPNPKIHVLKASTALLSHIRTTAQSTAASSNKKSLLTDSSPSSTPPAEDAEPIWLVLTTKKHIVSQKRLKPSKIPLPHSLNTSSQTSICLITADPQRTFKDVVAHPSFPSELGKRITKVVGVSKLKAKYKSFESRRQLKSEHDIILADARIITLLPPILGKAFYGGGTKRPIPINLEPSSPTNSKDKSDIPSSQKPNPFSVVVKKTKPTKEDGKPVAPPQQCAKEIERALGCALVHLSPAATTSVRVGLSTFAPAQLAENVAAVVTGMVEKHITHGWRNVKAIHLKGPNTMALPIWLAEELWVDEGDILGVEEAEEAKRLAGQKGKKRKGRALTEGQGEQLRIEGPRDASGKKRKIEDTDLGAEMKQRREKLRKQKAEVRDAEEKLGRVGGDGEENGNGKVKRRKKKDVEAA